MITGLGRNHRLHRHPKPTLLPPPPLLPRAIPPGRLRRIRTHPAGADPARTAEGAGAGRVRGELEGAVGGDAGGEWGGDGGFVGDEGGAVAYGCG